MRITSRVTRRALVLQGFGFRVSGLKGFTTLGLWLGRHGVCVYSRQNMLGESVSTGRHEGFHIKIVIIGNV